MWQLWINLDFLSLGIKAANVRGSFLIFHNLIKYLDGILNGNPCVCIFFFISQRFFCCLQSKHGKWQMCFRRQFLIVKLYLFIAKLLVWHQWVRSDCISLVDLQFVGLVALNSKGTFKKQHKKSIECSHYTQRRYVFLHSSCYYKTFFTSRSVCLHHILLLK